MGNGGGIMSVPKEHRKFCAIPVENEGDMNWDDLLQDRPIRFNDKNPSVNAVGTKFIVKYDGRNRKPYCLYGYDTYTYEQAKAISLNPESEWYIANPDA
jgi:hypothetical protein